MPSSDDSGTHPKVHADSRRSEARRSDPTQLDAEHATGSRTAADVLGAWWLTEAGELARFEALTRSGQADALHQARVRVRALRSAASVYRTVFDRRARRGLDSPLAALGAVLGAARDAEVRELALRSLRDAALDDDVRNELGALGTAARAEADSATLRVMRYLDSADHASLMIRLTALVLGAPAGPSGADPIGVVTRGALRRAARRVSDRAAITRRSTVTLDDMHALRKASRRLRYAAEAVGEAAGVGPQRVAGAAEAVQNALGDHRDGVLLAGELRARADAAAPSAASALRSIADETDAAARAALSGCDDLLAALAAAIGELR